eukprot:gene308-164_t
MSRLFALVVGAALSFQGICGAPGDTATGGEFDRAPATDEWADAAADEEEGLREHARRKQKSAELHRLKTLSQKSQKSVVVDEQSADGNPLQTAPESSSGDPAAEDSSLDDDDGGGDDVSLESGPSPEYPRRLVYDRDRKLASARLYGDFERYMYWFVHLLIGSPTPQRVSVIADTGSSLCGFPCSHCTQCGEHIDAAFDLALSSSGEWVSCSSSGSSTSASCRARAGSRATCRDGKCSYYQAYVEGSAIRGHWFEDYVRLGDAVQENFAVKAVVGCHDMENKLFFTQEANGILGLAGSARDSTAVVHAFLRGVGGEEGGDGTKLLDRNMFSMCLAHNGGKLIVGGYNSSYHLNYTSGSTGGASANGAGDADDADDADDGVSWVPFDGSTSSYYHVVLSEMESCSDCLPYSGSSSESSSESIASSAQDLGETLVDSGTTFTYFPPRVYDRLLAVLDRHCEYSGSCGRKRGRDCWRVDFSTSTPGARLKDQLDERWPLLRLRIGPVSSSKYSNWFPHTYLYVAARGLVCLTADENYEKATVLGASWMMDRNVVFDVGQQRFGWADADCPEYFVHLRPAGPDAADYAAREPWEAGWSAASQGSRSSSSSSGGEGARSSSSGEGGGGGGEGDAKVLVEKGDGGAEETSSRAFEEDSNEGSSEDRNSGLGSGGNNGVLGAGPSVAGDPNDPGEDSEDTKNGEKPGVVTPDESGPPEGSQEDALQLNAGLVEMLNATDTPSASEPRLPKAAGLWTAAIPLLPPPPPRPVTGPVAGVDPGSIFGRSAFAREDASVRGATFSPGPGGGTAAVVASPACVASPSLTAYRPMNTPSPPLRGSPQPNPQPNLRETPAGSSVATFEDLEEEPAPHQKVFLKQAPAGPGPCGLSSRPSSICRSAARSVAVMALFLVVFTVTWAGLIAGLGINLEEISAANSWGGAPSKRSPGHDGNPYGQQRQRAGHEGVGVLSERSWFANVFGGSRAAGFRQALGVFLSRLLFGAGLSDSANSAQESPSRSLGAVSGGIITEDPHFSPEGGAEPHNAQSALRGNQLARPGTGDAAALAAAIEGYRKRHAEQERTIATLQTRLTEALEERPSAALAKSQRRQGTAVEKAARPRMEPQLERMPLASDIKVWAAERPRVPSFEELYRELTFQNPFGKRAHMDYPHSSVWLEGNVIIDRVIKELGRVGQQLEFIVEAGSMHGGSAIRMAMELEK